MEDVIEMENTPTVPNNELEQRYIRYKDVNVKLIGASSNLPKPEEDSIELGANTKPAVVKSVETKNKK